MTEPVPKKSHIWDRHPEDFYIEPEWCSERLFEAVEFTGRTVDPACGTGRIVKAARAAGLEAAGTDLVSRSGYCLNETDFLRPGYWSGGQVDNIVSNPPFGIARQFAMRALVEASSKVALLLPTVWLNGVSRGQWLETTPLAQVHIISPRPSMPPGPVIEAGETPGNGTKDFAWFVWRHGRIGPPTVHFLRRDA